MISQIVPLAVGNAVKLVMQLPSTAIHWRVLRNLSGAFAGFDDVNAAVVHDANSDDPLAFIDAAPELVNGTQYFYQGFYWDGSAWTTDAAVAVTPSSSYVDESVDAQSLVRDRLRAGISAEIARGFLKPVEGTISVLTAPPVFDDTRWPVISVHLQSEAPAQRGIGEDIANDRLDTFTEAIDEHEGWLAKTQLQIVGWSLNSDERIELRKAIRRIIVANLAVFDDALLLQVELSQQDIEDFTTYSAPVYETLGTFTCLTPIAVNAPGTAIIDVESTVIPLN